MTAPSHLDTARRKLDRERHIAAGPRPEMLTALVPDDRNARAFIRAEAAKRDLSVSQLVRRIVETVIADRLVAAVLDDADEIGRRT